MHLLRVRDWLSGWYHTLEIRVSNPELYKVLTTWTDDDLFEVGEPE